MAVFGTLPWVKWRHVFQLRMGPFRGRAVEREGPEASRIETPLITGYNNTACVGVGIEMGRKPALLVTDRCRSRRAMQMTHKKPRTSQPRAFEPRAFPHSLAHFPLPGTPFFPLLNCPCFSIYVFWFNDLFLDISVDSDSHLPGWLCLCDKHHN